ncbi:MAG: nucleotidyltransferase family protein [Deltaproteobacteria bacterium]|nr:nucleotidyltransferase family protein [Deltaproteobacteria bacterium]MBW2117677.1 nucleotidyltransferase family protein [Deltaproteobacteria bacterium]MBW2344837.1 nucleotidyltransferase family protein [Deltaproteobacteria bacterium]
MSTIEQQVLTLSAELNPDCRKQQEIRELMTHDPDPDHLINIAIKEGLVCLLYKNLKQSGGLELFSKDRRKRIELLYHQTAGFNLRLIYDLREVLGRLNQNKIQVVLLQGIVLLQKVYKDVGLRPMTDIDLWVLEKNYPRLTDILMSSGYRKDRLYPNTYRKGATTLDLHTHILGGERIKARAMLFTKSQYHIYADTRVMNFEGHQALCLNPYDQVLYLGLHALKHNVNRLIWLVDIKGLVSNWNSSDWNALMDRAKEMGQEKSLSCIFFLLRHLLDFYPPEEVRQFLERDRLGFLTKRLLEQRIKKDFFPVWAPFFLFSPGKIGLGSLTFIFETLFPREEVLRQVFADFPDLKVWQLYWMRILQLLVTAKMSLKRS